MKTRLKTRATGLTAALAVMATLAVYADDQKDKDKGYRTDAPKQPTPAQTDVTTPGQPGYRAPLDATKPHRTAATVTSGQLGKVNKVSSLIGMEVKNQQNEKLGKIDDLVIDLQSGRVAYAIVSSGGILGVGDKQIAVPTSAFTYAMDDNKLVLNADRQRLQSAPAFDKSAWKETPDRVWLGEVYRYHGQEPYWDRSGDRIQLRNEQLNETIESQRERLKNEQDQFNRDANRVPVTPGTIDRDPAYQKPDQKPDSNPGTPDVDNTRRNERDRSGDTLTPEDQGRNAGDREISRMVRKSIVIEKGPSPYSVNARNIKIMTTDGVVTLRGIVDSQAEKDSLEAKAKAVAGVSRVDNQLEVKSSTK